MSEYESYNMISQPDEYKAWSVGYEQGRADTFQEIAYSDAVIKEPFEELAYQQGRADGIEEYNRELKYHFIDVEDLSLSSEFFEFVDRIAGQMKEEKNG